MNAQEFPVMVPARTCAELGIRQGATVRICRGYLHDVTRRFVGCLATVLSIEPGDRLMIVLVRDPDGSGRLLHVGTGEVVVP